MFIKKLVHRWRLRGLFLYQFTAYAVISVLNVFAKAVAGVVDIHSLVVATAATLLIPYVMQACYLKVPEPLTTSKLCLELFVTVHVIVMSVFTWFRAEPLVGKEGASQVMLLFSIIALLMRYAVDVVITGKLLEILQYVAMVLCVIGFVSLPNSRLSLPHECASVFFKNFMVQLLLMFLYAALVRCVWCNKNKGSNT